MPVKVQLDDGRILEFANTPTQQDIQEAVSQLQPIAPPQPSKTTLQKVGGGLDLVFGGAKLGEAIGTSVAGLGRLAQGDVSGFRNIMASQVTPKEITGDILRTGALFTPVGGIATRSASLLKPLGSAVSRIGGFSIGEGVAGLGFDVGESMRTGEKFSPVGTAIGVGFPIATAGIAGGVKLFGTLASEMAGVSTGAGGKSIQEFYRAVSAGGERSNQALRALRGKVTEDAVVQDARLALDKIVERRNREFEQSFNSVIKSTDPINIAPIRSKLTQMLKSFGVRETNGSLDFSRSEIMFDGPAQADIQDIYQKMKTFGTRTGDTAALNIDRLKRAFASKYSESSKVRAFVASMEDAARKSLSKVRGYPEMERAYSETTGLLDEMRKTLTLGDKATRDATLKKLLSSLRQQQGFRDEMLKLLDEESGQFITAQIAGQQLKEVLPSGILRAFGPLGAGLAGFAAGPVVMLKALAIMSPRLVGEFVAALGFTTRQTNKILRALETIAPKGGRTPGDIIFNGRPPAGPALPKAPTTKPPFPPTVIPQRPTKLGERKLLPAAATRLGGKTAQGMVDASGQVIPPTIGESGVSLTPAKPGPIGIEPGTGRFKRTYQSGFASQGAIRIGGGATVGSLAGFERDENGRLRYNPKRGLTGAAVGAVAGAGLNKLERLNLPGKQGGFLAGTAPKLGKESSTKLAAINERIIKLEDKISQGKEVSMSRMMLEQAQREKSALMKGEGVQAPRINSANVASNNAAKRTLLGGMKYTPEAEQAINKLAEINKTTKNGVVHIPKKTQSKGIAVIGGDAIALDVGDGIRAGYRYTMAKGHSRWAASQAVVTRLFKAAAEGYNYVPVVVYPNLMKAARRNPLFNEHVLNKLREVAGKKADTYLRQGKKAFDALTTDLKTKSSPEQEALKLYSKKTNTKNLLSDVAYSITENDQPFMAGKIIGYFKMTGVAMGEARAVKHPSYSHEILGDRFVQLEKPIPFDDLIKEIPKDNPMGKGGAPWTAIQQGGLKLSASESEIANKLVNLPKSEIKKPIDALMVSPSTDVKAKTFEDVITKDLPSESFDREIAVYKEIKRKVKLAGDLLKGAGVWTDGAERTTFHLGQGNDWDTLVKAGAEMSSVPGHVQKQFIAFKSHQSGLDELFVIKHDGRDLKTVKDAMDKAGIDYKTIGNGKSLVFNKHGDYFDTRIGQKISKMTQILKIELGDVDVHHGFGDFFGSWLDGEAARAEAPSIYKKLLDQDNQFPL